LREVLGIAKKEVHDSIVDLVRRKRLSTEPEPEKPVEVWTTYLEDVAAVDELAESHYFRPHWARATTETTGDNVGRSRLGDQPDVLGVLQEGQMAD
jgi:hypothetical protein